MRKEFINAKYVDHKYARKTCSSAAAKMIELFEAVQSRDLLALIQVYAEGVELMEPLPEVGPVSPPCNAFTKPGGLSAHPFRLRPHSIPTPGHHLILHTTHTHTPRNICCYKNAPPPPLPAGLTHFYQLLDYSGFFFLNGR